MLSSIYVLNKLIQHPGVTQKKKLDNPVTNTNTAMVCQTLILNDAVGSCSREDPSSCRSLHFILLI